MSNEHYLDPGFVTSPAETVEQILDEKDMSYDQFVEQMPYDEPMVDDIIEGRIEINPRIADSLEDVLGKSASFWLDRADKYNQPFVDTADYD